EPEARAEDARARARVLRRERGEVARRAERRVVVAEEVHEAVHPAEELARRRRALGEQRRLRREEVEAVLRGVAVADEARCEERPALRDLAAMTRGRQHAPR